jgi:hypothetical protein
VSLHVCFSVLLVTLFVSFLPLLSLHAPPYRSPPMLPRISPPTRIGVSLRNNRLRYVSPLATFTARFQSSLHPDQHEQRAQFIPTPVYEFHGVSAKDMLMNEMRHHDMTWTAISEYFQVHPTEAFFGYVRAGSTARRHGWSPRMSVEDIRHHVKNTKASDL